MVFYYYYFILFFGVVVLSVGCVFGFGGCLIIVFDFRLYLMCLTCDHSPASGI